MKISNPIITILLCLTANLIFSQDNIWVLGNEHIDNLNSVEHIVQQDAYDESDILIYLGNSFADKDKKDINIRIKELRNQFDRVYLVPGDQDWNSLKAKKLKNLGDFLDDEFKGDVIVPENSCGAIEVKEIGDDIAFVFIDSQWYFNNWEEDKNLNKKCEISSRGKFWVSLQDEIGSLKAKRVFLMTYHPFLRFDDKGGYHPVSSQIFPLTKIIPGAYIPLPIIGTMLLDTREYFRPRTNSISVMYQEYTQNLKNLIKDHGQITVISSDANYTGVHLYHDTHQLVINSTEDKEYVRSDRLNFDYDQPSILQINVQSEFANLNLRDLNSMQIKWSTALVDQNKYTDEIDLATIKSADFTTNEIRPIRYEKDFVHLNKFIFGNLNSEYYADTVIVPKLDLTTYKGGLTPLRLGGGKQTVSLRLEAKNGKVYQARSLKKDPEKSMPVSLRIEPFENVVEYYFMAANPLGFMAVTPLEKAANVLHTTPTLMHLPKQVALAPYNDEIGDELVQVSERADENWEEKESYGYSDNIISSSKMIDKIHSNKGTADAEMFLRARLVDYLVNDWDRHADQWRWAEKEVNGNKTYLPIPRDRDQVFSKFDGIVMKFLRPYATDFIQLRNWDDHLTERDITWMHFKSAYLDNIVLHQLTDKQWDEQTNYVANNINDQTLQSAIDNLPPSFNKGKKDMKHNMASRLAEIKETSNTFKKVLKKKALIFGSNDKDEIILDIDTDTIEVIVSSIKKDKKNIIFKNKFNSNLTQEIWIYGLDDDDKFIFNEKNKSDIKIRLIGGYGKDHYGDNKIDTYINIVDDQKKSSKNIPKNKDYRFTKNKELHALDRYDMTPMHTYLVPTLGYNSDDGVELGGSYHWIKQGHKRSSRHILGASYLTGRNSTSLTYSYRSKDQLSNNGKYLEAYWSGVQRQTNYYGGNGSTVDADEDFYIVNLSDIRLEAGLDRYVNNITTIEGGLYGWGVKADDEEDEPLFIESSETVNEAIFDRNYFAGLNLSIELSNFDSALAPTKGARVKISNDTRFLFDEDRTNHTFLFEYDYYKSFFSEEKVIFSTKIRAGHIFGDYYLYEGFQLGGRDLLRGYSRGRFTGKSLLAQNSNIHFKLFERTFDKAISSSLGLTGSFDHGRVYSDVDLNDDWQYSYGGGIWISPLNIFVVSAGYHKSKEDAQIRINFNWQF